MHWKATGKLSLNNQDGEQMITHRMKEMIKRPSMRKLYIQHGLGKQWAQVQ